VKDAQRETLTHKLTVDPRVLRSGGRGRDVFREETGAIVTEKGLGETRRKMVVGTMIARSWGTKKGSPGSLVKGLPNHLKKSNALQGKRITGDPDQNGENWGAWGIPQISDFYSDFAPRHGIREDSEAG